MSKSEMTVWEIIPEIERLTAMLMPDPETGEVMAEEEVLAKLENLSGCLLEKKQNLCKIYLQARAQEEAAKNEKMRVANVQAHYKAKAESVLRFLDYICAGNNEDFGTAKLKHTTTRPLQVSDAAKAATWLEDNGYFDLVTYQQPKLDANAVKKLISSGVEIPGCSIGTKVTANIK